MAANTFAPFGFRAATGIYGASVPNFRYKHMLLAYNNAHTIAYGDPVILLNTGYIDLYSNGGTTGLVGIFRGCQYANTTAIGGITFSPQWNAPTLTSGTVVDCFVEADVDGEWEVQVSGAALTQVDVGYNIDVGSSSTTGETGNPNAAGFSQAAVLSSSAATTNTLPFRITGIVGAPAVSLTYNSAYDNNVVTVRMNNPILNQTTGI